MLPGRHRFTTKVYETILISQKSAIIISPEHTGLFREIINALITNPKYNCEEIIDYHLYGSPFEYLWSKVDVNKKEQHLENLELLFSMRERELSSKIFFVKPELCDLGNWVHFIKIFNHVAHNYHDDDRVFFVIYTEDSSVEHVNDLAVATLEFQGFLTAIDMRVHLNEHVEKIEANCTETEFNLHCSLIANLSIFDTELVDHLVLFDLYELLDPNKLVKILDEYAKEKNWISGQSIFQQKNNGSLCIKKNKDRIFHSAYQASTNGYCRDLYRRVWIALNEVLMPVMDNHRVKIIDYYETNNKINWLTPRIIGDHYKEFKSRYDNDIGDCQYRIKCASIYDDNRYLIESMNKLRNDIAHYKDLDFKKIRDFLDRLED